MNQDRRAAADAAYENYDFGDGVRVEDDSGWEYSSAGNTWTKPVFVKTVEQDPDDPTTQLSFEVRFEDGCATIAGVSASDSSGNLWGTSGARIGIRVVVDSIFRGDETDIAWLRPSVEAEAGRSIAAGLLSHGHSTAAEYTLKVVGSRQQEVDLDEEQIADWIAGSIESGNMKLEDIPKLMARYALADPAEMRSELAERMGL